MTTEDIRATRAGRRRRTHPALRRAVVSATSFTLLLGLGAGGVALYEYQKLNGQITHQNVLRPNDPNIKQASVQANAVNYLVIGSDSRSGANAATRTGQAEGERSDTTILIHLSKDRKHVTVVSIPRDSWVDIPACTATNTDFGKVGATVAEHHDMFNSAFSIGGAQCTIATVQKLTGVRITHYLKLDFVGFADVVNALGTVTVCSPEAFYDPQSELRLTPGNNQLNGAQALAFVRARHGLGDGSDLDRIKRQQQFLGILLRQALSGQLLSNPLRLTDFLDATTKAITADRDTGIGDLRTLGSSMSGLDPKRVVFYTAPIANRDYSPPGTDLSGKVLLDTVKGQVLYDSIINDTAGQPTPSATPSTTGSTSASTGSGTPTTGAPTSTAPSSAPVPNGNAAQKTCSL